MTKTFEKFTIALCQMKVVNNKSANLEKAKIMIEKAVENFKPELVILPEYFNCPVGFTETYAEEESSSQSIEHLSYLSKNNRINIIGGSMPIKDGEKFYNTTYCFNRNGEIKARHRKVHLFDIDIPGKMTFQESKVLSAGTNYTIFDADVAKIGIGICYDIRFNEYAQALKKFHNVDMLVYPAAFNTVTGPMHWHLLHRSRALDNNVFLAICSPARNTENPQAYQCYGHSSVNNPFGKTISTTGSEEDIIHAQIDKKLIKDIAEQIPTWKQRRNDMYELVKKI